MYHDTYDIYAKSRQSQVKWMIIYCWSKYTRRYYKQTYIDKYYKCHNVYFNDTKYET